MKMTREAESFIGQSALDNVVIGDSAQDNTRSTVEQSVRVQRALMMIQLGQKLDRDVTVLLTMHAEYDRLDPVPGSSDFTGFIDVVEMLQVEFGSEWGAVAKEWETRTPAATKHVGQKSGWFWPWKK